MTKSEAEIFIDEMESIGDVWTVEQVMDVYGNVTLEIRESVLSSDTGKLCNEHRL